MSVETVADSVLEWRTVRTWSTVVEMRADDAETLAVMRIRVARMLRALVISLIASAMLATPASALPGDPDFAPLTPADGAAVQVNPAGIAVQFTCPVYRVYSAGEGFDVFGGPRNYGVSMATSPTTGADGRLADPVALTTGVQDGVDLCAGALGAGGAVRPQETPGTYYWQVWRLCTGCAAGYEVGPVRRIVLRAVASVALRPPAVAYGGFAFILPVALNGVANGTAIRIERRVGTRWLRAGSAAAAAGRAEATMSLPNGTARLRAVIRLGSETVLSPEVSVAVRVARVWTTNAGSAGRYQGLAPGNRSVRLLVAGTGREIRGFTAKVPMLCPTPGMVSRFTTQIGTASLGRILVAPDGTFVATLSAPKTATAIRIRGRLKGRVISSGRVELSVGHCSGSSAYTAGRVG